MEKKIYFCLDRVSDLMQYALHPRVKVLSHYCETEAAIKRGDQCIITTSIAHISFDIIDKGYDVYLCYKDKKVKVEEGMMLGEDREYRLARPSYYDDADILHCFMSGYFDDMLGIKAEERRYG